MGPLPNTDSGAKIAFYLVVGIFGVIEQRVRLRSWRNRQGSREDRGSLLVVIVSVAVGIGGGFAAAAAVRSAAIPGRWPIFILWMVLMCVGSRSASGQSFSSGGSSRSASACIQISP